MPERIKRVEFQAQIAFEGSIEEFKAAMERLGGIVDAGLKIGTWPTPESVAETMMIDTVPLPEGPFPGIFPFARLLDVERIMQQLTEYPRFVLMEDIRGGIRNPHLHIGEEVIMLDREAFKAIVKQASTKLIEEFAAYNDYVDTAVAMSHMLPGARY